MRASPLVAVVFFCSVSGCSAIVAPDTRRLGGVDSGTDAFSTTGCPAGCDDGIACTNDRCVGTTCEHAPDDSRCAASQRCAPTGCVARMCASPAECDDGNACTIDRCVMGACMPLARDADADGRSDAACGGDDCDDTRPDVRPGLPEVCGNGLDDDCDPGTIDGCSTVVPDDCATAQRIDLTATNNAVVRGQVASLRADYASFCVDEGRRMGRDAVYQIDIGSRLVDLVIETEGTVDMALSVSADCGSFLGPACNDDRRPGEDTNSRMWLHPTTGTLFLLVSAVDAMAGPYEVRITALPVTDLECGNGTLDVTRGGTVVGVSFGPDRATGSCMPAPTVSVVEMPLRFEGGDIGRLRLFAAFQGYLYVRPGCDPRPEVSCSRGGPIGATGATYLETGVSTDSRQLHIFVDGATRSDEVYALFVEP